MCSVRFTRDDSDRRGKAKTSRPPLSLAMLGVSGLYIVLLAGCTGPTTFTPPQPDGRKSRPAPANIEFLRSQKDLGADYTYPEGLTTQLIRWRGDADIEWRLRLATRRYAYAGIAFRVPYDFSKHKSSTVLSFRMAPANMAPYISIGLVDGNQATNNVLLDLPLAPYVKEPGEGTATFRIPLDDFGEKGLPIAGPGAAPHDAGRVPFDWTDVNEIRFSTFGNIPRREIVITEMRFKR